MKQNSKRGSAMVLAVFLLVLVMVLGAVLCTWGLLNVQSTVNVRASDQAYYTAKSVVDATVAAITQTPLAPGDAVDAALLAVQPGAPYTTTASTCGLPARDGTAQVKYTCEGSDWPDDPANGTQVVTITATVAMDSSADAALEAGAVYTRSVARQVSITRTSGGAQGILCIGIGGAPASGKFVLNNNTVIKGDVLVSTTGEVNLQKNVVKDGNVYVKGNGIRVDAAFEMDPDKTAVLISSGAFVFTHRQARFGTTYLKASQYNLPNINGFDKAASFPSGVYGDKNATQSNTSQYSWNPSVYWNSTFDGLVDVAAMWDAVVPDASYTLLEHTASSNTRSFNWSHSVETVSENCKLTNLFTQEIQFDPAAAGGVLNVDLGSGIGSTDVTFTLLSAGTVNLYLQADTFALNSAVTIHRPEGATLNFVSPAGNITVDGNKEVKEINLLAPAGALTFYNNAKVHGTIWGNTINCTNNVQLDSTVPETGAWWGDISGVASLSGGGGGGGAAVAAAAGAYVESGAA